MHHKYIPFLIAASLITTKLTIANGEMTEGLSAELEDPDVIALLLKDKIQTNQTLTLTEGEGVYDVVISESANASFNESLATLEDSLITLDLSSVSPIEQVGILEYLKAKEIYGHQDVYFQHGIIEMIGRAVDSFYENQGSVLTVVKAEERERNINQLIVDVSVSNKEVKTVRAVSIEGAEGVELTRRCRWMIADLIGKEANISNVELLKKTITSYLYKTGRLRHYIEHSFRENRDGVDLTLKLRDTSQNYFGKVSISGSKYFDSVELKKSMHFKEGALANFQPYERFGKAAKKDRFLDGLKLSLTYPRGKRADADILLQDNGESRFQGGAYYSTNLGYFAGGSASYSGIKPVFGGSAASGQFKLQVGEFVQNFRLNYKTAYLSAGGLSFLDIELRDNRVKRLHDLFDHQQRGVKASYRHLLKGNLEAEYFMSADIIDIQPSDDYERNNRDFERNYNRIETGVNLRYSIHNEFYDQKSYRSYMELALSHILSGSEGNSAKVELSNESIFNVSEVVDIKLAGAFKTIKSGGSADFVFDNLFLGGDELKAFSVGSIGGYSGGKSSLYSEVQISRKITDQMKIGVFYEVGSVYADELLSGSNYTASNYGVMVSMKIPQGSLSVYAAFPDITPDGGRNINGSNVVGFNYGRNF